MREFFQNVAQRFNGFMQGRYGVDEFSIALIVLGFVFTILAAIIGNSVVSPVLSLIALVLLVAAVFRAISRNIPSREGEREWYLNLTSRFRRGARMTKLKAQNRGTAYLQCEHCNATLSVPKGKGYIRVRCPKCGEETLFQS